MKNYKITISKSGALFVALICAACVSDALAQVNHAPVSVVRVGQ